MAFLTVQDNSFPLRLVNISDLETVYSPEYTVNSIPWIVRICKDNLNGEQWLAIYLQCAKKQIFENSILKWEHIACPTFKLISFNDDANNIENHLPPHVFDGQRAHGIRMLRWNDLMDVDKGYIKDNTINLNIQIKMIDSDEENKSELVLEEIDQMTEEFNTQHAKYRFTVTNVEHLMAVRSPEIILQNMPWYVTIYKHPMKKLFIMLESMTGSRDFSCAVNFHAKLANQVNKLGQIRSEKMTRLKRLDVELASWIDLLKPENGFIEDNSLVIEFKIYVGKPEGIEVTPEKRKAVDTGTSSETKRSKSIRLECMICLNHFDNQKISFIPCGHMFCAECIEKSIKIWKKCPCCNKRVTKKQIKQAFLPV